MKNLIEPYNPSWKLSFEAIRQELENALQQFYPNIDIQHVGSTSIPGLMAKPVLDIDIILHNKSLLNHIAEILEKMGYENKGDQGIAGRFAFRQSSAFTPLTISSQPWHGHHLYVCFSDSLALKNHLAFRDALIQHTDLVEKYAQVKMTLVNEPGMTRETYQKSKTEFILGVLEASGFNEAELKEIRDANE